MDNRGRRGKGEAKDAAGALPVEETDERAMKIEEELNGMKRDMNELRDEMSEVKTLLKLLTEGKRVDGGFEEKEDLKKKIEEGIEPRTSPEEGNDQSSEGQQKPQVKPNSKTKMGRLSHETLVRICWTGEYLHHRNSVYI